jgi:DNA (cytosine-5)-methyltransferase 1
LKLAGQAAAWPTPGASDGSKGPSGFHGRNPSLKKASIGFGPQVLQTPQDGESTSERGRVLNPLFVEALMGWPIGWTDCDSAVTEWSQWLRRWRSLIFGSNSTDEAEA